MILHNERLMNYDSNIKNPFHSMQTIPTSDKFQTFIEPQFIYPSRQTAAFVRIHLETNEKLKASQMTFHEDSIIVKVRRIADKKLNIKNLFKKDNLDLVVQIESQKRILFLELLRKATYSIIKNLLKNVESFNQLYGENRSRLTSN